MKMITFILAIVLFSPALVAAQGNAFSFQGRLNDGASPANGRYDLQFKLFDAIAGGNQVGPTVARPNTALIDGVFSVVLDFGPQAFTNPNSIFIEIAVKPTGGPNPPVVLGPRQQLTVVPFASRAQNSTNADSAQNSSRLGGVPASDYVTEAEGSVNYIRNGTAAQPASNFNISGNGTINGSLSVGGNQSLVGNFVSTGSLQIGGNARQDAAANGLVKAMIVFSPSTNTIARCYNGITNSSTGNCGFTITTPSGLIGVFRINFGFTVSNRFVSVTGEYCAGCFQGSNGVGANYRYFDSTSIEVFTFANDSRDTTLRGFTLILF